DAVYRYDWAGRRATLRDSLVLAVKRRASGTRYPAGLALSADGKTLYVAENLADSLAVIDVATGQVNQRFPAGRYPYDVARAPDGRVYVSTWGGNTLSVLEPLDAGGAWLSAPEWIDVARHPSTLLFNADGS